MEQIDLSGGTPIAAGVCTVLAIRVDGVLLVHLLNSSHLGCIHLRFVLIYNWNLCGGSWHLRCDK